MLRNLSLPPTVSITPNFLSLYKAGDVKNCTTLYLLEPGESFLVGREGSLHHEGYGDTRAYCVEIGVQDMARDIMVLKCQEDMMCHQDNMEYHILFTILGIVSLLALVITFIVYVSVPDLFNLHGKIVVSNVTSIFLVTLYIIVVYNVSTEVSFFCTLLGYFGYFVSISMFCWMTVLCLDLCRTFCSTKLGETGPPLSKFVLFSIFAWGLAAALTIILLGLDLFLPASSGIKPNIGTSSCFIEDVGFKRLFLFHIPILVLMVINLILFLATIVNLTRHLRQTRSARCSRRLVIKSF